MNLRLAGILDNGQWDNGTMGQWGNGKIAALRHGTEYRRKTKEMRQNDDVR